MGTVRLWATKLSPREPARTHTRVPSHHTHQKSTTEIGTHSAHTAHAGEGARVDTKEILGFPKSPAVRTHN